MGFRWAARTAALLAFLAGTAVAQSSADAVVQQLRDQGYVGFEVSRTLLGRVQVIAEDSDGEQREIVFNPITGEILRDYVRSDRPSVPRILDRPEPSSRPSDEPVGRAPTPAGRDDPAPGGPPGETPVLSAIDAGGANDGDDGSGNPTPGNLGPAASPGQGARPGEGRPDDGLTLEDAADDDVGLD